MIRTLQIGDEWLFDRQGGLARYYFEFLRHLPAERASAIGLVVGHNGAPFAEDYRVRAFAKADDPVKTRMLALRRAAMPFIRAKQIDLIACHFALYGLPIVDRLHATPTVMHFHGPWAAESGVEGSGGWNARAKAAIESVVYRRARQLIVLSEAFRTELVQLYRVPDERVCTVPGGVDIERFNTTLSRQEARERLGWPQDRRILLTVRRQVKRMGLEELIDALQSIRRKHPELLTMLCGSGSMAAELSGKIADLGLGDHARMLGRITESELPLAYRAADLSIVPTQTLEGFGLVVLESLASGTPVLVSPVGGLPELLQPFAPQCVLPDTTASGMATILDEVLSGKLRIPTENECRAYAETFSWNKIASRVIDVYQHALR